MTAFNESKLARGLVAALALALYKTVSNYQSNYQSNLPPPSSSSYSYSYSHSSPLLEAVPNDSTASLLLEAVPNDSSYPVPGEYSDPNHPNCKRSIRASESASAAATTTTAAATAAAEFSSVVVTGTDGSPGCPPDGSGVSWSVEGSFLRRDGRTTVVVDFSPKGGPEHLTGTRTPEGILWEDGNLW
eukprot:CAMPEP_0201120338 /NCGR_PEP_ID=MMETSP0850-20130426/4406_1 /ASSEMBLY_ACC=CAM_ASM_000622 /TAXON_ID=183588 /ORGANISM="Pseudo-nitzschia fraudulenta, Strain WWA7" /LENGTH=186 /DNA_ID=CAMNT_0047386443 /DNA_START=191 /DNA_END=748 /DNA_ORIENTATION=+